jgi:hypothetical protein
MNEAERLLQQLVSVLPPKLGAQVYWVYPQKHWDYVLVCFRIPCAPPAADRSYTVKIPKTDWLNDVAIARICLEAP